MKRSVLLLGLLSLTNAAAPQGSHKVSRTTPALEFLYEWPSEAVAIPALDHRFYTEAKAALAAAQKDAASDQQQALKDKRPFNQHSYSMTWTTAGQTPRLLSLQSDLGTFAGGAHPNSVYGATLWNRPLKRTATIDSLFLKSGAFATLTRARYCVLLDAERKKRRQGEKLSLPDFNSCPKYADLAIALVDKNNNGAFDNVAFVASPYTAGPYVEGVYDIMVPITSQLIAAVRPEFRPSFERQRQ